MSEEIFIKFIKLLSFEAIYNSSTYCNNELINKL